MIIFKRYALSLLYIWGHAYEFDDNGNWSDMEEFCRMMTNLPDVWYATNIEIYRYFEALRALVTSADGSLWYLRVLVCSREGAIPGAAREYSQICLLGQNRLLVQENESYLPEGWTAEGLYIL